MKLRGHPLDGTGWGVAVIVINLGGAAVWLYFAVTQGSVYWAALAVLWVLIAGVWAVRYARGKRAQESPRSQK